MAVQWKVTSTSRLGLLRQGGDHGQYGDHQAWPEGQHMGTSPGQVDNTRGLDRSFGLVVSFKKILF